MQPFNYTLLSNTIEMEFKKRKLLSISKQPFILVSNGTTYSVQTVVIFHSNDHNGEFVYIIMRKRRKT